MTMTIRLASTIVFIGLQETNTVGSIGKRKGLTGRWCLDGFLEQRWQDGRMTDQGASLDGSKTSEAYSQEE